MGENSSIEWTDDTFNPWVGCTKVSPGCANCYAERDMDHRYNFVKWGKGQPRRRTSVANWKKPHQWNRKAQASGKRARVFCASLADWLDPEVPAEWLRDLLVLIDQTPHLDWLLLTKRPWYWDVRIRLAALDSPVPMMLDWLDGHAPDNVWIGVSVENQSAADERVPALLNIPAGVRFLSCEPLLGSPDLSKWLHPHGLHWVICGGESGPSARPMQAAWARRLRDQCDAASVPFFFKQWGEYNEDGKRVGRNKDTKQIGGIYYRQFPESATLSQ